MAMERFDSSALFDIFKAEGNNLLDFDGLGLLLDFQNEAEEALELAEVKTEPGMISEPFPLLGIAGDHSTEPGQSSDSHQPHWQHLSHSGTPGHGHGDTSDSGDQVEQTLADSEANESRAKKKRTRNTSQMEMNRVAQQKYRERKKHEYEHLQTAVDVLTAQLAALKAQEVRAAELERTNKHLSATVLQQGGTIQALQQQVNNTGAELNATRASLSESQALVSSQQKMILDQHSKLALQEQVIAALKERLKDKVDEAMSHMVPGTVCEKLVGAVKAALYGAKDCDGVQDVLATLPESMVYEICKNIMSVCKEMWPELKLQCHSQATGGVVVPQMCS